MSPIEYSVWVLVLQVAAYSSYLDFGLQTAVGRYIAIANETQDTRKRDSIFSTAVMGLSLGSIIAILALITVSFSAGALFPKVPPTMLPAMRAALLIVGSSIALGLPSSAWSGVFIGIQRNELIAAVIATSRIGSALALIWASILGVSIVGMAVIVATVNVISYCALYYLVKRFSDVRFRWVLVQRKIARELSGYCFSLMIWSFATLLVTGLDLLLVGRYELQALIPYALATSLVNFIAGIQTAVFGATMPHAAVLHARRDAAGLGEMVISTTRAAVVVLLLTGLPILIYSSFLFRLWVGQAYASQGHRLIAVLMAANILRLTCMPYSVVLVASGQQRKVTLSPLMEGFSNLFASVILGHRYGAIGVAAGTLIGGVVGLLGHFVYNMPRTQQEVFFRIRTFLFSAIGFPILAATPLIVLLIYRYGGSPSSLWVFAFAYVFTIVFVAGRLLSTGGRKRA